MLKSRPISHLPLPRTTTESSDQTATSFRQMAGMDCGLGMEDLALNQEDNCAESACSEAVTEVNSSGGDRKFYVLVQEACGLPQLDGVDPSSCVSLQIGEHVVQTSIQSTRVPLWNQMLEIAVPSLPASVKLTLENCSVRKSKTIEKSNFACFEMMLTPPLEDGFADEWISVQEHVSGTHLVESEAAQPRVKLHIACSFNPEFIRVRQRGLWPSHEIRVSNNWEGHVVSLTKKLMTKWSSSPELREIRFGWDGPVHPQQSGDVSSPRRRGSISDAHCPPISPHRLELAYETVDPCAHRPLLFGAANKNCGRLLFLRDIPKEESVARCGQDGSEATSNSFGSLHVSHAAVSFVLCGREEALKVSRGMRRGSFKDDSSGGANLGSDSFGLAVAAGMSAVSAGR